MKRRWTSELADFLRFCASERRLALTTCSAYERDVSACLGYLQGQGSRDLAEVKVTHLRAFLAEEQKRRPAVSSQARTTAALRCFFRFLIEEERIARDVLFAVLVATAAVISIASLRVAIDAATLLAQR